MPITVDIEGVGVRTFPDEMPVEEIERQAKALQEPILKAKSGMAGALYEPSSGVGQKIGEAGVNVGNALVERNAQLNDSLLQAVHNLIRPREAMERFLQDPSGGPMETLGAIPSALTAPVGATQQGLMETAGVDPQVAAQSAAFTENAIQQIGGGMAYAHSAMAHNPYAKKAPVVTPSGDVVSPNVPADPALRDQVASVLQEKGADVNNAQSISDVVSKEAGATPPKVSVGEVPVSETSEGKVTLAPDADVVTAVHETQHAIADQGKGVHPPEDNNVIAGKFLQEQADLGREPEQSDAVKFMQAGIDPSDRTAPWQYKTKMDEISRNLLERAKAREASPQAQLDESVNNLIKPKPSEVATPEDVRIVSNPDDAKQLAKLGMREMLARRDLADVRTEGALRGGAKKFSQLPEDQQLGFQVAMDRGSPVPKEFQTESDIIRQGFEERTDYIKRHWPDQLENLRDSYFPHVFERPEQVELWWTQKKGLSGSKAFAKERTFPYLDQALDAGFKPVSTNPVDVALVRYHQMDKFITANDFIDKALKQGIAVDDIKKAPTNWKQVGPSITGRRNIFMPAEAADVINNHLSPRLSEMPGKAGDFFRWYKSATNTVNGVAFSLSTFHATTTGINSIISAAGLAMGQVARGQLGSAIRNAVEAPIAPFLDVYRGAKFQKMLKNAPEQSLIVGPDSALVEGFLKGGQRVHPDTFAVNEANKAFLQAMGAGKVGEVAKHPLQAVTALARAMSYPVMQMWVPNLKTGAGLRMMRDAIERLGPDATDVQKAKAFAEISDSLDNRFGEMVRDNLMWNNTLTDLAHVAFQTPGWFFGTWRNALGALHDLYKTPSRVKAGGMDAAMTRRMEYMIALPIVVGTFGGMTQYILTGRRPERAFDFFEPQYDPEDHTKRIAIADIKELLAPMPQFEGPGKYFGHKINKILVGLYEGMNNQDYAGRKIVKPTSDTKMKDALQWFLNFFTPYSVSGAKRTGGVGSYIGFPRAPKYIEKYAQETEE